MDGSEIQVGSAGGSAPEGQSRADNRTLHRIPVRLAVSQKGRSAPLGRTRDLSLQGVFIETREPLGVGAVLPLSIELEPKEVIEVRAEVMRCTDDGMGLRFRDLSRDASRALRRWIVAHTSVQGDRKQVEQLLESSAKIEPIRDPVRIQSLLADIRASRERVTLILAERSKRAYAKLVEVQPSALVFELTADQAPPDEGGDAYVLLTLAFVSYSFSLTLTQRRGSKLTTSVPSMIVFSERRTRERREAPPGSVIRWPSGIIGGSDEAEFRLVDISDHGLAFAAPHGALLMVGTPLEGASIVVNGRRTVLQNAEIRNLRLVEDTTGSWVRVGVSFGTAVGRLTRSVRRAQPTSRFGRLVERVRTLMSVVFQRGRQRILGTSDTAQRIVLRNGPLPLVGLLDRTTVDDGRLSAPLVIVVPGFAGRKEQMAFLAGIMIEGFQRQNADLAVLRLDGTNNLGESGKDPECRGDGMHALHYTISGVMDDLTAAVAWAKKNPLVDASHIVIVSVSMGSIGVRQYLTRPDAAEVSLWVSFMGAPDAIDAIRNVSGNIDLHAYHSRGQKLGVVSLAGVLTDGDHFWQDLNRLKAASLEDAQRDMAAIRADVVWLRGRYDAFMDPRRVDAIMAVPTSGAAREIIDVESGHLPRTGSEAISQFLGITERIWREVADRPFGRVTPSIGRLAMKAEAEWTAVRREPLTDRADWWKGYLLDENGPGFDILEYAPSYVEFMDISAARTLDNQPDTHVLELGAGTGNLTRRLLERGARVTAVDFVPEALEVLRHKCAAYRDRLETRVVDLEGSALLAFRRFARGDLPNLAALSERVPGFPRKLADEVSHVLGDELYAVLRGFDIKHDLKALKLSQRAELLVRDCALIARAADGRLSIAEARAQLRSLPESTLDGARGLVEADGSMSAVALSLVVSYLQRPEDIISEAFRVLKRGGTLVLSSLVRDSESSQLYMSIINRLETLPPEELPGNGDAEQARASLIAAARRFVEHGADLLRLEEEGLFRFYDADELERLVVMRGFVKVHVDRTFGVPPQAVVITCSKP